MTTESSADFHLTADHAALLVESVNALAEGIAIFDKDYCLVVHNRRYAEMLHPIADLIRPGASWFDLLRASDERQIYRQIVGGSGEGHDSIQAAIQESVRLEGDVEVEHADGKIYHLSFNRTESGGFILVRNDVTERRRAERLALEREKMLALVLDTIPIAIVMARMADGKVIYRSEEAKTTYDLTFEYASDHYADAEARARYVAQLKRDGKVKDHRVRVRRADGSMFEASLYGRLAEYEGETCVISAIGDLTERIERDRIVRRVLEACPAPILMADAETGEILFQTPELIALFGEHDNTHAFYVDPSDRADFVAALRENGFTNEYRMRVRNAKGQGIWTAISARLILFGGREVIVSSSRDLTDQLEREEILRLVIDACPTPLLLTRAGTGEILFRSPGIEEMFGPTDCARDYYPTVDARTEYLDVLGQTGRVNEHREQLVNARGEIFWVATSARLIRYNGEDVIVSHLRDITEQIAFETELEAQRRQVFQNEKMSALGSLLAGVAHELNNPLSVVVGHAMMLNEDVRDPAILRQTQKIGKAAERCAKIVKTFLTMARQEPTMMEVSDAGAMIETAVDVARYGDVGARVPIECDLATNLPMVRIDRDQITQVVINLLVNAEQAVATGDRTGRIRVSATRAAAPDRLCIVVEDNGPGVPAEIRSRIFDPFFTTKDVGKGTGIGLAFCHQIITAHGGTLRFEPVEEGGARFVVELPAAGDAGTTSPRETEAPSKVIARVLVIDDEPDVAELNAEVLERGGCSVDIAYSGREGLELLARADYDAVISDLHMPDIDGRGIFEAIRADHPRLVGRTGFITGDTMGRVSQDFLAESGSPYLEKPVSPNELVDFVSGLLKDGKGQ